MSQKKNAVWFVCHLDRVCAHLREHAGHGRGAGAAVEPHDQWGVRVGVAAFNEPVRELA